MESSFCTCRLSPFQKVERSSESGLRVQTWTTSARSSARSEKAEMLTNRPRTRHSTFYLGFSSTWQERKRRRQVGSQACSRKRLSRFFHLDEEMLLRSTQLAAETALELQSFDAAILAAVLVREAKLHMERNEVSFCTHDTHLQPWDRNGRRRDELADLLDDAGVWVYGDFLLEAPARPRPYRSGSPFDKRQPRNVQLPSASMAISPGSTVMPARWHRLMMLAVA